MKKFKCKHDWEIERDYFEKQGKDMPCLLKCKKCRVVMSANEAAEMELWKHTTGILKWLSIGAFLISIASLVVSFIK